MTKKTAALMLLVVLAFASEGLANKTSVAITAPETVTAGTEVTITIKVSHNGNSAMHFTNWVVVKADGKEIARWDFKSSNRPESAEFSRQAQIKVDKPVEITAQGHCIIHGSKGPATFKIGIK